MRIIYLGHIAPQSIVSESKAISIAGNNMEIGLLSELTNIYNDKMEIFSVLPFASFPKSSTMFINKKTYKEKNIVINSIPFINIFALKQISIILYVIFIILKELSNTKITVITYNAPTIYSLPISLLSKIFNNRIIKVCLVVDIPIMFQKKKGIREIARKFENFLSLKLFKNYDGMITLVENTVTNFTNLKKYLVINYSPLESISTNVKDLKLDRNKINITFTGAVEEYYGIKEMIQTMKYLSEEYCLNIFGSGSLDDYVIGQSRLDSRIIHHGRVAHDVSIEAQKQSDLLFLVRTDEMLNKFGLPSKVIEYLSSGTPVITNKIESIPTELYKYLNFYEEINEKVISSKIKFITDQIEYKNQKYQANQAKDFIELNYNWENQGRKIEQYISLLNREV